MFGDGADSNANIALSAALRQQLQITCIPRPYDRSQRVGIIFIALATAMQNYISRRALAQ